MEKWYKIKDFKDTNNVYEVSDKGNVRKGEKILKLTPNKRGGYWCVTLYSTISQKGYFTMVQKNTWCDSDFCGNLNNRF